MSSVIDVKGFNLASDLIWTSVKNSSILKESVEGSSLAVVVKNNGEEVFAGYFLPIESVQEKEKLFSIAAIFAKKFRDEHVVLLFAKLGDNVVLVAIKNGLPVPDFDRYGKFEEMILIAEEFLSENPSAKLIGDIEINGLIPQPFCLADFFAEKNTRKLLGAAILKPIVKKNKLRIILALIALVVIGYSANSWYQDKVKVEVGLAAASSVPTQTPLQSYMDALPGAIAHEAMSHSTFIKLVDVAMKSEIEVGGWDVSTIRCDSSGCGSVWVRASKTATFQDLISQIGIKDTVLTTDETALKVTSLTPGDVLHPDINNLPSEQGAWLELITPLQKTSGYISYGLTKSKIFPAGNTDKPPLGAIMRGELRIQGSMLATEYLESLPPWAAVKSVDFLLKTKTPSLDALIVFFHK